MIRLVWPDPIGLQLYWPKSGKFSQIPAKTAGRRWIPVEISRFWHQPVGGFQRWLTALRLCRLKDGLLGLQSRKNDLCFFG